jgi:hypothetical protein
MYEAHTLTVTRQYKTVWAQLCNNGAKLVHFIH